MNVFKKLGVVDPILQMIEEKRFEEPTEIQMKTIPLILEGKDVIAGAATGSGKTLAFGVGIIQHINPGNGVQALVLTPTRELANQVAKVIVKFSKHMPHRLNTVEIYGGVAIGPQIKALKSADIVVGTPGRILDHLERRTIDLSKVKILVLDEADRMLDMGFIDDVENIITQCSQKRQTLFFSATISHDISKLAKRYMHNPERISVDCYVDPSKLTQVYYNVKDNMKFSFLVHLLKNESAGLVMVFCNSRHNTDFVARNLKNNSIDAIGIHGGLTQAKRERIIEHFHSGKVVVLVCTDVAARGLDIKDVSHVYNYDIPNDSTQYVHRIGRTARAGKEGKAVNILGSRDYENFDRVIRDNRDMTITLLETPYVERAIIKTESRPHRISRFSREGRFSSDRNRGHNSQDRNRNVGNKRFGNRRSFGRRSS